jgi:hypothetical protein
MRANCFGSGCSLRFASVFLLGQHADLRGLVLCKFQFAAAFKLFLPELCQHFVSDPA